MRQDVHVSTTTQTTASNALLADLQWRGLLATSTDLDQLSERLDAGPIRSYCGFDPTAPSLHVGNLVPLLLLARFQSYGHQPIALVGGATGLIGDPSGRATERSLNSDDVVADWVGRIRTQVSSFVDLEGPAAATVVSNLDWTSGLTAITFLRDIGKHFSVNVMLAKDSVKARLVGEGMSYTEFSYMLLQAYDYLELYRQHDCRLQIGGSDQWGNITAGLDLIRKIEGADADPAHALTVPLVTKADGEKFGKTAGGAIWLDPEQTSPFAFYQFWLNADDRDAENFLKLFSMRSREELETILVEHNERPPARLAQRGLADELTAMIHGEETAEQVRAAGKALFGKGSLADVDETTAAAALASIPRATLSTPPEAPSVVDLLVLAGLCESRGAARRAIKEGGAYLNGERVTDEAATAGATELIHDRWWVLRRGKRTIGSVELIA